MEIAIIIISSLAFLGLIYILLGVLMSRKICYVKPRSVQMLYRNEWKENFTHDKINPPHSMIFIRSRLDYDMSARFFPSEKKSHKYILMLHGYNNCSLTCGKYALLFNEKGINCLAPDSRRSGGTNNKAVTFGYYERSDAEQWIEEIYKMDPKAEIGLFGISLGAATAILIASMRTDIKYLISYCSFASFKDIILDKGSTIYPKTIRFFYPAIVAGAFLTTGARLDLIDIAAAMKNVTCPVLIMHSKGDAFTPYRHAVKLHEANPLSELKSFEKHPHARAYSKDPQLYKKYLDDFLSKSGY